MNCCSMSIAAICAANGANCGFGRGGRVYFGASSVRSAARTVFRASPNCTAMRRMPSPWACR